MHLMSLAFTLDFDTLALNGYMVDAEHLVLLLSGLLGISKTSEFFIDSSGLILGDMHRIRLS